MITLRKHPLTLLFNYSLPVLFTLNGLFSTPLFSSAWWGIIFLVLLLCVLLFFWPVEHQYYYPYLIVEIALILGLTALHTDFMLLGFIISAHAAILLSLRNAILMIGAFWLCLRALITYQFGWSEDLMTSITLLLGFISFGFAYNARERAETAQLETQRLLDDLREAHQKLETYAAQAQELAAVEERNRIARELHDTVKQQAFAVSGQLGAARSLLSDGKSDVKRAAEHLRAAESLMDEIRSELGQLIHALRPVTLEDQGLASVLRDWCSGWSQQSRIPIDVRVTGERRLALETEQALFRIVQEALSNVARHSRAARAEVCLDYAENSVNLTITDNGKGFNPAQPASGIGLQTMRERTERLDRGTITIESSPGKGAQIEVHCRA